MYPVPPSATRYGDTERIIGNWLSQRPGVRSRIVLATKAAGPVRGYEWLRNGSADVTADDIVASCEGSLKRLQTEVIDLYQLHWPTRNVPMFGSLYYDPKNDRPVTPIDEQLRGLQRLVQAGKVRHVGVSNETPWGVAEFVRLADAAGLPRIASVQNAYSLLNRSVDNGLDELMQHMPGVAAGLFAAGLRAADRQVRRRRLRRPGAARPHGDLRQHAQAAPRPRRGAGRGAALQRAGARARPDPDAHGAGLLLPQLARGQHAHRRHHASRSSTRTSTPGTPSCRRELLAAIDRIRWEMRDPAQ